MSKSRCAWVSADPLYIKYHDTEWGVPVYDDHKLFEFLILETFQAGLSWLTILRRRENFRKAFDQFDVVKVSRYKQARIDKLLQNEGIIRNKGKIEAAIINAQNFIKIQSEFGSFSKYIWGFVDGKPIVNRPTSIKQVPPTTALSEAISKDLKKRGFKFVGSTVMYAHMQATGMVDDHTRDCFRCPH